MAVSLHKLIKHYLMYSMSSVVKEEQIPGMSYSCETRTKIKVTFNSKVFYCLDIVLKITSNKKVLIRKSEKKH